MALKHSDKWVSTSIFYEDFDRILTEAIPHITSEAIKKKYASKFIFNRNWQRGKNIILLFKTTDTKFTKQLKPLLDNYFANYLKKNPSSGSKLELPINDWFLPYPNNSVIHNERFFMDVMEVGGLEASLVSENVLQKSSEIILMHLEASGADWSVDAAMGLSIQMHLAFVASAEMDETEAGLFYQQYFDSLIEKIIPQNPQLNSDNNNPEINNFILGLDANFELQKESVLPYIEFIWNSLNEGQEFDNEWMNEWISVISKAQKSIKKIQSKDTFIIPEGFTINKDIPVSKIRQERWPVYQYYLRSLSTQMGILDSYEFNLLHTLKSAFSTIEVNQE